MLLYIILYTEVLLPNLKSSMRNSPSPMAIIYRHNLPTRSNIILKINSYVLEMLSTQNFRRGAFYSTKRNFTALTSRVPLGGISSGYSDQSDPMWKLISGNIWIVVLPVTYITSTPSFGFNSLLPSRISCILTVPDPSNLKSKLWY